MTEHEQADDHDIDQKIRERERAERDLEQRMVNRNRAPRKESEQAQHEPEERFYDSVGRPRKLAAGAMTAIIREYRKGNKTTRQLAERYGVSPALILTIVYHTPRGPGKRPKPAQYQEVNYPNDTTQRTGDSE